MKINGINTASNLSKVEEIKILETLHKAFLGSDNYLESLFSNQAVEYISRQIKDDIMPDLHSSLVNESSRVLSTEYDLRQAEDKIKELNKKVSELRDDLEHVAKDRDAAWRSAQEYRTLYQKADLKAQKVNELREALRAVLESED